MFHKLDTKAEVIIKWLITFPDFTDWVMLHPLLEISLAHAQFNSKDFR
jgi:hypothetical protein